MKIKNILLHAVAVSAGIFAFVSCEDYPDAFVATDGKPEVHFIRYTESDCAINRAYMQETICLVGDNLRSVHEILFNDKKASLNTSLITDHTLIVQVPKGLPNVKTDKLYLITAASDTVDIDFMVLAPAPIIRSMSCEMVKPGSVATIYGEYFIEPLTVSFPNAEVTDFKSISNNEMTFTVPEGALPGKVKVTTESGASASPFMYLDNRGIISDFDGAGNSSSTTGIVPQGWNIKAIYSDEGGISGSYVVLGPSTLDENGSWQEELKLPFWCGNWNGDPMSITSGPGTPICNFIDFSDFTNMSLKFELNIPESNPWSSGVMQLVFASAARCANDSWQNNTYIQVKDQVTAGQGGTLQRGYYAPWKETGSFHTNGEWITVTIPFTDFIYDAEGGKGDIPLQGPEDFASFVLWPWNGGVTGTECTPIFKIDNIRAVPNK